MANKEKVVRSIDQPASVSVGGAYTAVAPANAPPAPANVPAPIDLTLTNVLLNSALTVTAGISARWTPGGSTNPQGYYVQYSTSSLFPDGNRTTLTTEINSALLDGLDPNVTYYVRVASIFSTIVSPWSTSASITTTTDLTPPAAVAQSSMTWSWPVGDLLITWTNPTSANFRDVRIEIWTDATKITKLVTDFSSTGRYVFTAAQNYSLTSGSPDPAVYVELTSRSWGGVYATATTFGALSTPTTQPNKPAPATPTGVAVDFTGPSLGMAWNASTGALDYIVTLDGVDYIAAINRFDYSFTLNRAQHGGVADPSITYQVKARDGLGQTSPPTTLLTAVNLPPSAVSSISTSWAGDTGIASHELYSIWEGYSEPADLAYYRVEIYRTSNMTDAYIISHPSRTHTLTYDANKTSFGGNGEPNLTVRVYPVDVFNQAATSSVSVNPINAAPPLPTVLILAGFTSIYGQITNGAPILDFDHYHYRLRFGGNSGVADGTIVKEWDDVIDTPTFDISAVGNYKIGVQIYDKFQQTRPEVVSDLVFVDALTLTQLRAEGQYSNSISTDFTSDPTGKANNLLLKDNAVGAGITYTATSATFGKTGIGGSTQDLAANEKRVTTFSLGSAGVIYKLTVRCSGAGVGTGSQVMRGIIYSNSSGPANLLAVSQEVTVTDGQAAGWVDLAFTLPVPLAAGTYWLGVHGGINTNTIRLYRDSSSNSGRTATDTYSDGTAATFGTATTVSQDISIYATYDVTNWRWTQFERPLQKIYNRIAMRSDNGNPLVVFETIVLDSSGSPVSRYWSGVESDGYTLAEHGSLSAAQAAAVSIGAYAYGWAELPVEIEARYVKMWHNGGFRLDEYYPRTMIRSDDIEAESIRAINIAASAIVADKIAAGAVTAVKLSVGIGGGNLLTNSGFSNGLNGWNSYNGGSGALPVWVPGVMNPTGEGYTQVLATGTWTVGQRIGLTQAVAQGVKPFNNYTLSAYVASDIPTVTLYIEYKDSLNAVITATSSTFNLNTHYILGQYNRVQVTGTAPANTASVNVYVWATASATTGSLYLSGIQLEIGDVPTSWKPGYRGNVQIDGDGILVGVYNGARTILTQGGLIGYNASNVEQARFDSSSGAITAGAGSVKLDVNGVTITPPVTSLGATTNIKWVGPSDTAGSSRAYIGAWISSSAANASGNVLALGANNDGTVEITALSPASTIAGQLILNATGADNVAETTHYTNYLRIVPNLNTGTFKMAVNASTLTPFSAIPAAFNVFGTSYLQSWTAIADSPVSGYRLLVKGQSTTSSTYQIVSRDGSNNNIFVVRDDGHIGIGSDAVTSIRTYIKGFGTTGSTYGLVIRDSTNATNTLFINDLGDGYLKATGWLYGPSSEVYKENIVDIPEGLEKLKKIKPRKFDYKEGKKNQRGFIAEELEVELPEFVQRDEVQGTIGVRTTDFIPILINAVKELAAEVELLKNAKLNNSNNDSNKSPKP